MKTKDMKTILKWLADGKKVQLIGWQPNQYIYIKDNEIIDQDGDDHTLTIDAPVKNEWQLFDENAQSNAIIEQKRMLISKLHNEIAYLQLVQLRGKY